MLNYSKGPWRRGERPYTRLVWSGDTPVAWICEGVPDWEANLQLVMKAPAMYETLYKIGLALTRVLAEDEHDFPRKEAQAIYDLAFNTLVSVYYSSRFDTDRL